MRSPTHEDATSPIFHVDRSILTLNGKPLTASPSQQKKRAIPCAGFVETFYYCTSSARASKSPANRRLVIYLPRMLTFPSCSSKASDMIHSRQMLKREGDRRHPYLTATDVLNHSPMLPFIWTALVAYSLVIELPNGAN